MPPEIVHLLAHYDHLKGLLSLQIFRLSRNVLNLFNHVACVFFYARLCVCVCIYGQLLVLDIQPCCSCSFIIRLEASLQPNVGFTLRRDLAVFTRSAVTPPKVNRFEWNLEHSEYIVGGWPLQILGAIRAVSTAGEPGKFFLSGK